MKKGDVIVYKRDFFLVTKVEKDLVSINKINHDGFVLKLSQKIPKDTKCKIIKGAKKKIKIELPFHSVNDFKYKNFVQDAKKCLYNVLTKKDVDKNKNILVFCSFRACQLNINGSYYDIATFAKNIGLKKPEKLFETMATTITYDIDKREKTLPALSDRGLNKVISNYMTFWKCYHGFNKKLDEALEKDFAMHMRELKRRDSAQD